MLEIGAKLLLLFSILISKMNRHFLLFLIMWVVETEAIHSLNKLFFPDFVASLFVQSFCDTVTGEAI